MNNNVTEMYCRNLYMLSESFLNEMNTCGIKYAVIKGCPLAYYKTGNPGTRLSTDIDILVSRNNVSRVTELLEKNGFQSSYVLDRRERIMLLSNSHQVPAYNRHMGKFTVQVDVNFDLFWGEYKGKRIDVQEFLEGTVELEIFGKRIKTLSPLKCMIQLILHHYKEANSLYHLTSHIAVRRRMFEDIYVLCQRFQEEISIDNLYEMSRKYGILPYVYYMFYYTRKVYQDAMLDGCLEALDTEEGRKLLNCYGLTEQERKIWKIGFLERLDTDVSKLIEEELSEEDKEKLERNKRIFG